MKYNFTSIIKRQGKDSIAADTIPYVGVEVKEGFNKIPMWVADMSFETVPTIPEAIIERAKHSLYGYYSATDEYYNSIIKWHNIRNGIDNLSKENIGYENGVLGGVVNALNVLCSKGDKVLLHSPTYIGFTMSLENNGYDMILSPLIKDENGVWRMDYADMEEKIEKHNITATVFCSPHNPCGRVWEKWEIQRAMELFAKHDVYVISDEIWSDILLDGNKHIPTQSVSEDARNRTIAIYAPSKTFNLAGLIGSYNIIYNQRLIKRTNKESSLSHYNNMNILSMHALIGAYKQEGYEWTDELCQTLTDNINYGYNFVKEHFKGVDVFKPQGTYMLFLDCTQWCKENNKTIDDVLKAGYEVGVIWQDGRAFHGECAIRMNLALPLTLVKEAFARLDKYVFNV